MFLLSSHALDSKFGGGKDTSVHIERCGRWKALPVPVTPFSGKAAFHFSLHHLPRSDTSYKLRNVFSKNPREDSWTTGLVPNDLSWPVLGFPGYPTSHHHQGYYLYSWHLPKPCVHAQSRSHVWLFATPWTVAPTKLFCSWDFQARILEWAAISSSRGSSQLRRGTLILCIFCIGRWILYHWATWGAWNSILMVTPLKFKSQSSVSGKMWTRQVFHFCEEI